MDLHSADVDRFCLPGDIIRLKAVTVCWLRNAIQNDGPGIARIKPITQASCAGPASSPRCEQTAIPIRCVVSAGGRSTMELADDPEVLIEERRTRRSALGCTEIPICDANMRAIPRRRSSAVRGNGC